MSELQTQHESWKAARARIAAAATKPKIIELVPPTRDPAKDVMDIIVAHVAASYSLHPQELMEGISTENIVAARRLAIALCVRRPRFDVQTVAKHFEVNIECVCKAATDLDPILAAYAISSKTPLELSLPVIANQWNAKFLEHQPPSIRDIQQAVCFVFGVTMNDMKSPRRLPKYVRARQAAMALCKHLTQKSLPEIGRKFGGRDHTTVLYGIRRMQPIMDKIIETMSPLSNPQTWATHICGELGETPLADDMKWKNRNR